MSAAHTPGPWEAGFCRSYGYPAELTPNILINPVILGRPVNITIAKIQRGNGESYANARLIAAAPELLAALQELADDIAERFDMASPGTSPGMRQAVAEARAAITKATGGAL